jgi:hydroxypyruvate isomerase
MKRRDFLTNAGLTAAGAATAAATTLATASAGEPTSADKPFKLGYGPHFGLFENVAGKDRVAQLEYAASVGFTAWEENGMAGFPVEEQERLAKAMERLNIRMGVFVAYGIGSFGKLSFTGSDKKLKDEAVEEVRRSIDVAKRVNAKWMTVVPGAFNNGLEEGYQTARCVELLKRCAEVV